MSRAMGSCSSSPLQRSSSGGRRRVGWDRFSSSFIRMQYCDGVVLGARPLHCSAQSDHLGGGRRVGWDRFSSSFYMYDSTVMGSFWVLVLSTAAHKAIVFRRKKKSWLGHVLFFLYACSTDGPRVKRVGPATGSPRSTHALPSLRLGTPPTGTPNGRTTRATHLEGPTDGAGPTSGQRGLLVCFSSAIEAAEAASADTASYISIPAAARGPSHSHFPPPPLRGVINRSSSLSNHRAPCDLPPIPRKWTCSFARAGWARRRSCAVWLWRCSRGGIRGSG
ncbi:hypothetical protein GW17_00040204 [Ensete ventricosum]|nr:hypothetical protein GW17_00040204 [Ensete ventricosum]